MKPLMSWQLDEIHKAYIYNSLQIAVELALFETDLGDFRNPFAKVEKVSRERLEPRNRCSCDL